MVKNNSSAQQNIELSTAANSSGANGSNVYLKLSLRKPLFHHSEILGVMDKAFALGGNDASDLGLIPKAS